MGLNNILEQETYIKFDRIREIKFTLKALAEIEKIYKDFDSVVIEAERGSVLAIKLLLYVGLRTEDKTLTYEDIDNFYPLLKPEIIESKITEAIINCFPDKKDIRKVKTRGRQLTRGDAPQKPQKTQSIKWEWIYFLGRFILGLSEEEFWKLTMRKFNAIFNEKMSFEEIKNNGRN